MPPSSWASLPPPTSSYPCRFSQSSWLSSLWHTANSHQLSILHIYVCVYVYARSVMSNSLWPCGLQPARLLYPWDSPGKNPGVGCHFLLQGRIWILVAKSLWPSVISFPSYVFLCLLLQCKCNLGWLRDLYGFYFQIKIIVFITQWNNNSHYQILRTLDILFSSKRKRSHFLWL